MASHQIPIRTILLLPTLATTRPASPGNAEFRPRPIRVVEQFEHHVRIGRIVVEQRHEDVPGVAADDDVLGLWEEPEPVSSQMALYEPAMTL